MTIHWCGTGLSAIPGLRRLITSGHDVAVYNRTVDKAREAVGDLTDRIHAFDIDALDLAPGDVVVSMLPGDWHVPLAQKAIGAGAHFVSSSYIAPEMRALDEAAKAAGVVLVNEVGLDPGIDHLMAHALVAEFKAAGSPGADEAVAFLSYCGGIPKTPNPFRYKFSWSPVGVLKALRSPSRSIKDFAEWNVAKPWDALSAYAAPLPTPETFEVYPNRDSLPFMQDYAFDPDWRVETFVRGTLRLDGWADAWQDVFAEGGTASDDRLKEMSAGFWAENTYAEGEPDRVVLCVDLRSGPAAAPAWHKTYVMDAWGTAESSAMARLVSVPVAMAVETALAGKLAPGVQPAPSDPALVSAWLDEVGRLAQHLEIVDHIG
jgi:saccharopine dehydrogenase (NADP+, L-glutamate forming)